MNDIDQLLTDELDDPFAIVRRDHEQRQNLTNHGRRTKAPANSLFVIHPTREHGTWSFTDPTAGLVNEPFVGEINDMIDMLVKDIKGARRGFALTFSAVEFPGHQLSLTRVDDSMTSGATYHCDQLNIEGWLCPALFCYFDAPPPRLFAMARAARK